MSISKNPETVIVKAGDAKLEQVNQFTCLGAEINSSCDCTKDITKRLAMARTTLQCLNNIWKDRGISISTKTRLLQALIWPIAIYSCDAWTLKQADERRISIFEMWCYRRILRTPYTEHRTNDWVLQKIGLCKRTNHCTRAHRHKSPIRDNQMRAARSCLSWQASGRVSGVQRTVQGQPDDDRASETEYDALTGGNSGPFKIKGHDIEVPLYM